MKEHRKKCKNCKGTGKIVYHRHLDNGDIENYEVPCLPCFGSGYFGPGFSSYTAEPYHEMRSY